MNIHSFLNVIIRPFRLRRMRQFIDVIGLKPENRVLDVGGTPFNWRLVEATNRVYLLNLPDPQRVTTGHPDNLVFVDGDGTRLPYKDGEFDVCFSNSVIEHVGDFEAQRRFAREVSRCGRRLWIQTPAKSFFFEPHYLAPFIHWLSVPWQKRLVRRFSGWGLITRPTAKQASEFVDQTRLLTLNEMKTIFPDCEIREEKFLLMTKSYVAVRVGSH